MPQAFKRVALITGAARGFGNQLVSAFTEAGYYVVATARQVPQVEIRDGVSWKELDVTDFENCRSVINSVSLELGHVNVLVNNASAYSAGVPLFEMSPEAITQELDVTLRGAMFMSHAFVSRLRDQGHGVLVFISSTAGRPNEPGCGSASVYSAAKAGLIRFAEALQDDIFRFGMTTQVVVPGNMRDDDDDEHLVAENSVSYSAAARIVAALAEGGGNLSPTHVELLPARRPRRE